MTWESPLKNLPVSWAKGVLYNIIYNILLLFCTNIKGTDFLSLAKLKNQKKKKL